MDDSVLSLIAARRIERTAPGARTDNARIGLVVEGGGVRGVITAGMLAALEELGLSDVFDGVYGSSAGAVNSCYFIDGSVRQHIGIYPDFLASRRFINLARHLVRRPIIDLEYAFDAMLPRVAPLDHRRIADSGITLFVTLTALDPVRTLTVTGFRDNADLQAALKASCWAPFAVPGVATFRGVECVDGSLLCPIPLAAAIADSTTHVLVLASRHAECSISSANPIHIAARRYFWHYLDQMRPGLAQAHVEAARATIELRRRLDSGDAGGSAVKIFTIAPDREHEITKYERSPTRVLSAGDIAKQSTLTIFRKYIDGPTTRASA